MDVVILGHSLWMLQNLMPKINEAPHKDHRVNYMTTSAQFSGSQGGDAWTRNCFISLLKKLPISPRNLSRVGDRGIHLTKIEVLRIT